jgi:hypothetical protein
MNLRSPGNGPLQSYRKGRRSDAASGIFFPKQAVIIVFGILQKKITDNCIL